MLPGFPMNVAIPFFILLGATFIMLVYHTLLYLQYREKVILKYCFYLLSISLYLLADLYSRIDRPANHLTVAVLLADAFNFITILSYASFLIETIPASKDRYKRLYTIWQFASTACLLYVLFCLIVCLIGTEGFEKAIFILNNIFRTIMIIIGVGASIIIFPLMKGKFLNCIKWGAISYLFFMGLVMIDVLLTSDRRLFGLNPMHYVYLGTFVEVVIFSVAMSYKVKDLYMKVAEVRNRLSRDLHDEIGATLSGVTLMSELVMKKLETGATNGIQNYVERITTESKQMSEKMNDIVWAANPDNDSLEKIIVKIQSYASGICSAKNIMLHFAKPPIRDEHAFSNTARNNLYLISKEAINNAVKYSGATNIWFIFELKGKQFTVSIRDDGNGFEPGSTVAGNGLKNMRARAEEMGAVIRVISGKDKGTAVELSFV